MASSSYSFTSSSIGSSFCHSGTQPPNRWSCSMQLCCIKPIQGLFSCNVSLFQLDTDLLT